MIDGESSARTALDNETNFVLVEQGTRCAAIGCVLDNEAIARACSVAAVR